MSSFCDIQATNLDAQGFYLSITDQEHPTSWVPVLPGPLILNAQYAMSQKSHVSNTSTLILHFFLKGIRIDNLAPYVVELVLREYLEPRKLRIINQMYDFTDNIDDHAANVKEWVRAVTYVRSSLSDGKVLTAASHSFQLIRPDRRVRHDPCQRRYRQFVRRATFQLRLL